MTGSSHPLEIVADEHNRYGESPCWDAAAGRLLWVDNFSGELYSLDPATRSTTHLASGLPLNAVAVNHDGRLVIAGAEGIVLLDDAGGTTPVIATHDGEQLVFNDITVGPAGAIYGGTFHWGADGMERHGRLLMIRGDGTATVLDDGIALSNGLGFSPDGRTLFFTDTIARKIFQYDVDPATGLVANRRVFVDVPTAEGLPDGLAVDAEGFVWSAQWYAGEVLRYDPDGRVERRLTVPAQQVSSVAFGGPDLADLYITSAGEYWPSDHQPPAFDPAGPMGGALYRCRPGMRGQAPRRAAFAGATA
ncbi:MAG: SMP-30/gluconolactonase/LRE family protein [Planctomycetia bacterium]